MNAARRRRLRLVATGGVVVIGLAGILVQFLPAETEPPSHVAVPVEAPPICPWREPDRDRSTFFLGSNEVRPETRILSGQSVELTRRLGRRLLPDERVLRLNRVYSHGEWLGSVLVRRVKGEFGAIEIALAVDQSGAILGIRLQRIREPEAIQRALTSAAWLRGFRGQDAHSIDSRFLVASVPAPARTDAAAIIDGVRSLLFQNELVQHAGAALPQEHHH